MKKKKTFIIIIVSAIVLILGSIVTYNLLRDKNKLNILEKNWINDNLNTVVNINVINNVNIFGNNGAGVFYDFLEDFSENYQLQLNPVTFNAGDNVSGAQLTVVNSPDKEDVVFYKDHYVLISANKNIIKDETSLNNSEIGVLANNLSYVTGYLKTATNVNYVQYNSKSELVDSVINNENKYAIVPLVEYMDLILEKNLTINYHFSDIGSFYVLKTVENDYLSSILSKYHNTWQDNLDESFKEAEFALFKSKLGISDTEIDAMRSMTYKYGFVNNSPYEVIIGGNYGGIVAVYLDEFSKFADVDYKFTKYKSLKSFKKAIKKDEVDLFFNYYSLNDSYHLLDNGDLIKYVIIAANNSDDSIMSKESLSNKTVYVAEDSIIKASLEGVNGIELKTYSSVRELKKAAKKNAIIAIDCNIYSYYANSVLSNYSVRYTEVLNNTYNFKTKDDNAFGKLLNKYFNIMDSKSLQYTGLYNHAETIKSGTILTTIAKYLLFIIAMAAIIIYVLYKSGRHLKVSKKIKKDEKVKFIDQLTSLKNRNYLKENIKLWNNNKVYPQTMIVIDLNNIQTINDTLGYEEGDKQIMALANVLIKTQLDNSDIIRTDGNEFLIYLIGYSQKQVANYIHKLNKEIKHLPYEYGAEFGFSMINDDLKTIEDAINEAVEEMKKQKSTVAKEA